MFSAGAARFWPRAALGTAICTAAIWSRTHRDVNCDSHTRGMVGIIPAFAKVQDSLRDVGYANAEQFPQIVCIGMQSSGKSSVLEMLVGEAFLPKGEGLTTKRPLVLTLHNMEHGPAWAEFPDLRTGGITDFALVEAEIRRQSKGDITGEPLRLDIYSPDVVDLRVIDLPGFIHNPKRDQAADLPERIKDIVSPYTSAANTVILAVCAANTDLQAAETLRFARACDPRGERTICVLSKIDLVDDDELGALRKTVASLPLRLGYVGVKCRTSEEERRGMSVAEARVVEHEFILKRFARRGLGDGLTLGVQGLADSLTVMLEKQVRLSLSPIIDEMRDDLRGLISKQKKLGAPVNVSDPGEEKRAVLAELDRFSKDWLGPRTLEDVKRTLAEFLYTTVSEALLAAAKDVEARQAREKPYSVLPQHAPAFWEGEAGVRYQRWRQDVLAAVRQGLEGREEVLTYCAVRLLQERISASLETLRAHPVLMAKVEDVCKSLLMRSYDLTVQHVEYLISLEQCVTYDNDTMERRYIEVVTAHPELEHSRPTSTISTVWKWVGYSDSGQKETGHKMIQMFGGAWTRAYLRHVADRLSINIYNALCVEVLDPLPTVLNEAFVVHLVPETGLLEEDSGAAQERALLAEQIARLQDAITTLTRLQARPARA